MGLGSAGVLDWQTAVAFSLGADLGTTITSWMCQLSSGPQQRVAIARALAMEPRVMPFDRPTSALNPELVQEVADTIRAMAAEGRTMVVVTHEMRFARSVAHRGVFMADGRITEQGAPDELFGGPRDERLRRFLRQLEPHGDG
jgi:ABC-type histidine transport system ATPase subunit